MKARTPPIPIDEADLPRAREIFDRHFRKNATHTDRMFAALMLLQWLAAIVVSLILSPRSWSGSESHVHPHVWLSLFLGGALASLPVYLALRLPGRAVTRQTIALTQMLFSSLLIQVSGGRIETHFHVFGSLAFLAFYRDWKVLLPATVLVAADHFIRGVFWPESVFGISTASPWRWTEHAGWVIYEDIFLIMSCRYGMREMWGSAARAAELERNNKEMLEQATELEKAFGLKNAVVETALDAVVTMDSEGRITDWNSQAEAIFGWSAGEVLGKPLSLVVIPAASRAGHERGLKRYLETGERRILNQRIEVSALHRDGHEFPVELAVAPIRSATTVSFCAFARDITERLAAEETLRRAKEAAEAASDSKSAFLANMSHEIRTPLNGILGFANLLMNDIDGDAEVRRQHLQTIHDSGRHLLTVINDILDLSKAESDEIKMELVRCSPYEIIAETVSILRVPAQERGLHLEYFWKSEIPESIESDPARLRQILMNLVGNAIKFTEVGSVQVAARLERGESPRLVIDVIDTGVGIAAEGLERIFEPFVQADNSITRRFGGTGLGLAISRRLAALLGGEANVSSTPGRGSTFTFSIATGSLENVAMIRRSDSDMMPARSLTANEPPPSLPRCRILLVEDGVTNRKLITLVLERAGAKVRSAENGQAGVEAANWESFDLILMDIQMPIMDGFTATRALRRSGYSRPIIALTAHAMKGDEEKCRAAGCTGYLTKPIDPARLLRTVADALLPSKSEPVAEAASPSSEGPIVSKLPLDDPEFREIVEEFIARFEEQLAAMHAAHARGDHKTICELAHWLKGAGGTVGFDDLTRPAAELEHLAKEGLADDIVTSIQVLEGLLRRMKLPANV